MAQILAHPTSGLTEAEANEALVAACRRGDPRARAELFDRHGPRVHRILLHILGPEPEVGDLTHDVFVIALERLDALVSPGALTAWISSIAVLSARGYIRRRQRFWAWPSRQPEAVMPSPAAGPEVGAALREAYAVLGRLPADERIAFVLRMVDRLRVDEIAELCRTSRTTVKRRLRRADERFRALAAGRPLLSAWLHP